MKKPEILYEDGSLMVVSKPSGWITNEASTTKNQPVLQTWIKENLDFPISKSIEYRSGIVHRLDKETSGALIIAKTKSAFSGLQKQFKERKVTKIYVALVHGSLDPSKGTIDAPVGRLPWRRDRFGVLPGGREASTSYSTLSNHKSKVSDDEFSLLELKPKTGRTHQIRIHMKHIGHPLVADEFYAGRKTARKDRLWCPRLFLHAKTISFKHPETGKTLKVDSELAKDLKKVLSVSLQ